MIQSFRNDFLDDFTRDTGGRSGVIYKKKRFFDFRRRTIVAVDLIVRMNFAGYIRSFQRAYYQKKNT